MDNDRRQLDAAAAGAEELLLDESDELEDEDELEDDEEFAEEDSELLLALAAVVLLPASRLSVR